MARKNKTISDTWRWGLYLVIGVLFMAGVVFFSSWQALHATEARFCQILDFVKSQSTSFEKHNDTITAKALRRTAVAVHQLAENPALDLSDPQCLNRQTEKLWLTGISVLGPDGTLRCESTTNGIGYDRFGDQLKNDAVLDVLSYPRKTYVKRVLLEDGSAVDVAAHRAESKEVILLAYRYTPAEFVEGTALSIQSVLDGYSVETSGTLFIVQNNQVIASNRPELIGQDAADSPPVREIRKAGASETLTHTHDWNGSGCYFGMYCHGRSFDLYAYTDERSVFRESFPLILMALAGYILLVMVLRVLRRRSVQEMEQQKKEQEMRDSLQVGDEITTIGGIMGRVVTVKEDSLIIETGADRNKMRIARWAVQTNNTANEKLAAEREAAQAKAQEERAKRSAEEGGKKRRGRKKDLDEVSTAKAEETAQAKKDEE